MAQQMGGCQKRPNDTPARRKYKTMGIREKNKARRIAKQAKKEAKQRARKEAKACLKQKEVASTVDSE